MNSCMQGGGAWNSAPLRKFPPIFIAQYPMHRNGVGKELGGSVPTNLIPLLKLKIPKF